MVPDIVDRKKFLEILETMTNGKIAGLRDLRQNVVDLNLTEIVEKTENSFFLALYLAKKLTADAWENLATDASFNLKEDELVSFARKLGEVLITLLDDPESHLVTPELGETVKGLYNYFYKISSNPGLVFEQGGENEPTKLYN